MTITLTELRAKASSLSLEVLERDTRRFAQLLEYGPEYRATDNYISKEEIMGIVGLSVRGRGTLLYGPWHGDSLHKAYVEMWVGLCEEMDRRTRKLRAAIKDYAELSNRADVLKRQMEEEIRKAMR